MYSILVKSSDRTAISSSSSDFRIQLPETIPAGCYRVDHIHMPHNIYNVTSSNNKVYCDLGDVTLTSGFYTSSTLATHLQTLLQVVDANFTVTYNTNQATFTIANSVSSFVLDFGTNTTNSARQLLGFSATDTASALL